MARVLLLFANQFPYSTWEPFLETETRYLADAFDRVHIFSLSVRPDAAQDRLADLDPRITVHRIPFHPRSYYALRALRVLGNREFYAELAHLARQRRLSPGRLVQLLVFLSRALDEARAVIATITDQQLVRPGDQVVYYSYRMAYQPYLARLVGEQIGVRGYRVARAHGADLYEENADNGYIPLREATVGDSLDAILLVAQQGLDYLRSKHPEYGGKMQVARLGTREVIDTAPAYGDRRPLRLVSCSNMVPVKRLDLLIQGLSQLRDVAVEWTHFGAGPLQEELRSLAQSQLRAPVTWRFAGHVPNEEVLAAYANGDHDVLVNVSSSEGIPVSMMEAASCWIPIIGTNVGGVAEIVQSGQSGRLLSADPSAEEVAQAIAEMATMNDEQFRELTQRTRRVWENTYRADSNYRAFADLLLAGGVGSPRT